METGQGMAWLEQVPDSILCVNRDRTIAAVNARTTDLVGFSAEELVGSDCAEKLDPRLADGRSVWADGWHRSLRLRSVRRLPEQELSLRCSDGTARRVWLTAAVVRDPQSFVALMCSLRPVSEIRPTPDGMEVIAACSHELRSPLTSVKGFSQLLMRRWDQLAEDQKFELLEQIHHDAERVSRMVMELLDISRLETGRLKLKPQRVDLVRLVHVVVDKWRLEYPDLVCEFEFAEDFPSVWADPDKIEQVLANLVENSAKYADPAQLRVSGVVSGDRVQIAVEDRGEGIPAEELPHIFEKFYRCRGGRPTGTGLGLWISRGLVEAHAGRLEASSVPGEGSVLTVTLPLTAAKAF
ncbi:MAG: Adaptive-response sensory-kinase SasA [Acidimicrobiales bacterium]|nr:MAG: PAS domain-containing sensor histidine kinase [Actinomycetota bacterium]MBV6507102.1 Adaptive-response sensory-kinase SasA [Acidimicrobiales bacterium]RIK05595.1 MAG: hypothetical protein DCC48_09960 [Acidobacteriota bacterium]